jgi:hypothetical protein
LEKGSRVKKTALVGLLLAISVGCGKAPDEKGKAEAARVAREVRDYANRIITQAEAKKKEEDRCWQHHEQAYQLACQYVQDAYPSAVEAQFPSKPDKVEEQVDRHLLIRSHYVGRDEEGRSIQVTWEATAYLNGKWQILCSEVISTKPL